MKFTVGDRCVLTGLVVRADLNGQVVTLLKWNKKYERWEVRCGGATTGPVKSVRVRLENLEKLSEDDTQPSIQHQLNPCFWSVLDENVRGDGGLTKNHPLIGNGQISNFIFVHCEKIAEECYSENVPVLAMYLDYIGKAGDSKLIQENLKATLQGITSYGPFPSNVLNRLRSAEGLGNLMLQLRTGTLAFIEEHQAMLTNFVADMKDYKLQSNRYEASTLMQMLVCGKDDNKSMKCIQFGDELSRAAMCGEVDIFSRKGIKTVKVNPILHQAYVRWLIQYVAPTLDAADARKGSLGKWHRLDSWEKQLTKSIVATPLRISIDVSNDFELFPWIEGLLSVDLKVLSDAPGVDTDRRILRLAFFAELALQATISSGVIDKKRKSTDSSLAPSDIDSSKSTPDALHRVTSDNLGSTTQCQGYLFKEGDKVVVLKLDEKGQGPVTNGMQGLIVKQTDPNHYSVSFTNLIEPQILNGSNLKKVKKVSKESHHCACGKTGTFLCSRCNMMWYCSVECQKKEHEDHKIGCKAMASHFGVHDLRLGVKKLNLE